MTHTFREVACLISADGLAFGWREGGPAWIADDAAAWSDLWASRGRVVAAAHTHPGIGLPLPSRTDEDTFAAVEGALGKGLTWYIASADTLVVAERQQGNWTARRVAETPGWLAELRARSWR